MDVLSFFGGVWTSIIFGVLAIAMVISCGLDRNEYAEGPKWWVTLCIVLALCVLWYSDGWSFSSLWQGDTARRFWANVGIYLAVGLGYSLLEFALDVRRSARYWAEEWNKFKRAHPKNTENLAIEFASKWPTFTKHYDRRIIGIDINSLHDGVEPKINRQQLAESIGVWTLFWPFYAISLVLGDLLTEVFRVIADVLAKLSGRLVRAAFKDVFKA